MIENFNSLLKHTINRIFAVVMDQVKNACIGSANERKSEKLKKKHNSFSS